MQQVFRWLLPFVFLIAAIASYSLGSSTGVFLFVILGFVFEGVFWFKLFPGKKSRSQ